MEIQIVPFDESHLAPIIDLSLRAWAPVFESLEAILEPSVYSAFYPSDWKSEQRDSVTTACTSSDHNTWVALAEGGVAGFVNTTRRDPVLGEIHMLAVDPDVQRQGIGTRLTEYAIERLRESGASVAMVETGGDDGHGPARLTYEAAGFRLFPVSRYFMKL